MKITPAGILIAGLAAFGAVQFRQNQRHRKVEQHFRFDDPAPDPDHAPNFEDDEDDGDDVVDAEVVEDAGIIFKERNHEEWRAALLEAGVKNGEQVYVDPIAVYNSTPPRQLCTEPFTLNGDGVPVPLVD